MSAMWPEEEIGQQLGRPVQRAQQQRLPDTEFGSFPVGPGVSRDDIRVGGDLRPRDHRTMR